MKRKKIFLSLIFILFISYSIIISTAYVYPMKRTSVVCKEILLQEYENYYGKPLPQNSKTEKIFKEPEKYLIIDYKFSIKNNTFKTLFVEDYSLKIPNYRMVYINNTMESYSYYEYKPNEESICHGQAIIYINDNDKQEVLNEVTKTMRINMWYWVYYNDFISLLTFSKI